MFIHAGRFCCDNSMGILVKTSHFWAGGLVWLAALAMPVGAQTPSRVGAASTAPTPAPAAQTAQQPVTQPAAPGRPNPLTLAAAQQGVLSCSSRINPVVSALGVSDNSGGSWLLPPEQQDQRLAPLVVEMPISLGRSAYISATFAPNQANGCGGMYETVVYWPQKCDVVANKNFGTLKKLGALSRTIYVRDGGVTTKIFLMPAGTGCVAIKKEIIR